MILDLCDDNSNDVISITPVGAIEISYQKISPYLQSKDTGWAVIIKYNTGVESAYRFNSQEKATKFYNGIKRKWQESLHTK